MIQFKKREIVFIFFMLVMVTTVIFGLGLFLGHEHNNLLLKPIEVAEIDPLINGVEADVQEKVAEVAEVDELQPTPEPKEEPPMPVEVVEVPEPIKVAPEPRALTGYTIQVDIMDEREVAELEMQRIQKIGFPSVYVRESAMGNRTLSRTPSIQVADERARSSKTSGSVLPDRLGTWKPWLAPSTR